MTNETIIYYIIIFAFIGIMMYMYKSKQIMNIEEEEYMEDELNSMIELDKLNLYYEVHMVGLDGECFTYSIYFKDEINDEKVEKVAKAIEEFENQYNDDEDSYIGYINVSKNGNKVDIFLDLGNVSPKYANISIQGILKAINNVPGIKQVIINEDGGF